MKNVSAELLKNLLVIRRKKILYTVENEKKNRCLNLVSFSKLENSETRLGNEAILSETRLSGNSIIY